MASDLGAPVTAVATGQSKQVKSTAAGEETRDESQAGPEERLYLGLGVACDSCGLFGQPTGARLLAVSTVPLPPVGLTLYSVFTELQYWTLVALNCPGILRRYSANPNSTHGHAFVGRRRRHHNLSQVLQRRCWR